MIILPVLAALTLHSQPPQLPSRLDPDDINALRALLEALTAGETAPEPEEGTAPGEAGVAPPGQEAVEETAPVLDDEEADDPETPEASMPSVDDAPEDGAEAPAAQPSEDEADAEPARGLEEREFATEEDAAPPAMPEPASETAQPASPAAATPPEAEAEPAPAPAPAPRGDATPAAPAPSLAAMGPHVDARHYERVRGTPLPQGTRVSWSVSVHPLSEAGAQLPDAGISPAGSSERHFLAGNGWAGEQTDSKLVLNDFTARRQLRIDLENARFTNSSLHAIARRNLDIYVFLSDGGQRETIEFGPGTSFSRFWLEAAMGVNAAPAVLRTERRNADNGIQEVFWRQGSSEQIIAAARYGGCPSVSPAIARQMIAGMGHTLALHPDLITALHQQRGLPCTFSFVIISPDSPQGRTEIWTRGASGTARPDLSAYARFAVSLPDEALLDGPTLDVALSSAKGQNGTAPAAPDFLGEIQGLRNQGDFAGALLTLAQETAHFGPCPAETIGSERLACAGAASLAQAGAGNAAFERVMEATTAVEEGAHRVAVENMRGFVSRRDGAGAAARTILANELLSMGGEGLDQYPGIDPVELLQDALIIDPFAPDAYWHLGRRYMEAGAPEAAWVLFDLGRALPGRSATPLLRQTDRLEENLRQLAPALFGPPPE